MKAWIKILLGISLSFMCLFTCVGYAALSTELFINGTLSAEPIKALFITGVSGGAYVDPNTLTYSGTVVSSDVTMQKNAQGEYEATYDITVWNNTNDTYYYVAMVRGTYTDESGTTISYSNENVVMTTDIQLADEVAPGAKRTFTVTVKFADDAKDTSDPTLSSIIEYQFSTTKPESSDEAAVAGVLGRFPEILNTPHEYKYLTDAMVAGFTGSSYTAHQLSYIGNVVGADDNDSEAIQFLFGESLVLNIDGEDKPITAIIKRENLDNNTATGDNYTYTTTSWGGREQTTTVKGVEMTLYVTAETLSGNTGSYVDVYAVVYTMNQSTGEWTRLGAEIYKGSAKVVAYAGGSGAGSFDTDTWRLLDENGNRTSTTIKQAITQN